MNYGKKDKYPIFTKHPSIINDITFFILKHKMIWNELSMEVKILLLY